MRNIDQPLFHRSVTPGGEVTSSVGYIRVHGRNYKTWFAENAQSHERDDYLYKVQELEPWIDRVKAVARQTKDSYVMSNNHYLGKATVNALEIKSPPPRRPSGRAASACGALSGVEGIHIGIMTTPLHGSGSQTQHDDK